MPASGADREDAASAPPARRWRGGSQGTNRQAARGPFRRRDGVL